MSTSNFVALTALLVVLFAWFRKARASSFPPVPPGPKPIPVLGNLTDLTAKELWLRVAEWSKQYGDVVYVHIFGKGLVFLNTAEAALELLDKRGSIYSDKPHLVMTCELCGCENMVAFMPYGDKSKRQRRLLNKAFNVKAIADYHPLLLVENNSFLRRLVADPKNYANHTRRYAGGSILSTVYGYEAIGADDKFLKMADECVTILANDIAGGGGIWPVDIFPFLRHLPLWAPGSRFLRKANFWKAKMEEFVDKPYEHMKRAYESGNFKPSFCSNILEDTQKLTPEIEFDLKWTANSMYSGSIDSSITSISHFLIAMMQHPEVLAKAQREIDTVIGNDRLPNFTDRPNLPYIQAIMSEVFRWGVPVPLALPHLLTEDDIFHGMHIPKGSLVFGNIWNIVRDERLYPEPEKFYPERFLEKVEPEIERKRDPRAYIFGFGRRICPGKNLVESSVWLLIASMVATLNISKPIDEHGNVKEPIIDFNNPVFRLPDEFEVDIRPRSEQALTLIKQSETF